MKLRIFSALITLFCSTAMGQEIVRGEVKQNISVLFIGNSYTFMNDMPFIFQKMAEAEELMRMLIRLFKVGKICNTIQHAKKHTKKSIPEIGRMLLFKDIATNLQPQKLKLRQNPRCI